MLHKCREDSRKKASPYLHACFGWSVSPARGKQINADWGESSSWWWFVFFWGSMRWQCSPGVTTSSQWFFSTALTTTCSTFLSTSQHTRPFPAWKKEMIFRKWSFWHSLFTVTVVLADQDGRLQRDVKDLTHSPHTRQCKVGLALSRAFSCSPVSTELAVRYLCMLTHLHEPSNSCVIRKFNNDGWVDRCTVCKDVDSAHKPKVLQYVSSVVGDDVSVPILMYF